MANTFVYKFYTDDGFQEMLYKDYLKNKELQDKVNDDELFKLFLGFSIYLFSYERLAEDEELKNMCIALSESYKMNPFQYYAPATNDQLDFINDDSHDVYGMIAGNRLGKTTSAFVKFCLTGGALFPVDRDWPIFKDHGVKYVPFRGPLRVAMATYQDMLLQTVIWPIVVRAWLPQVELGKYSPYYEGEDGVAKDSPAWGHRPLIKLKSDTVIDFLTYNQSQTVFESGAYKKFLWDEQPPENLFDGADERLRSTKGISIFSLTPHYMKGMNHTGGRSWVHPMFNRTRKKGHNPIRYSTNLKEVPDWILPESSKRESIMKWETEPKRIGDFKVLAEGRARLYGEPHLTGGLVLDEFRPEYSWIEPLWKVPPKDMTLYRAIDYGQKNPTGCLWFAVDALSNIYIYREYYSSGLTIFENVKAIIELSGNTMRDMNDPVVDNASGMIIKRCEEIFSQEGYVKTVLDGRTFASPASGMKKTIGWLFKMAGIKVKAASGSHAVDSVPFVNELFRVDEERKHIVTGKLGAPRMYVFSNCVNFRREAESWIWVEPNNINSTQKEVPRKIDDHLCGSCLSYGVQIPLRYTGNIFCNSNDKSNNYVSKSLSKRNSLGYRLTS